MKGLTHLSVLNTTNFISGQAITLSRQKKGKGSILSQPSPHICRLILQSTLIYFNLLKPKICSSNLLRLGNPCCNACFMILLLNISTDMPSLQNRSNCAFRFGFMRLVTKTTAKSGFDTTFPFYCWFCKT